MSTQQMQLEEELKQLTASVWDSILQLPLEPIDAMPKASTRTMSATVHITGPCPGAVALSCGADLAAKAAGIMFHLGDVEPTLADMQDALGELANMIGGNVKALFPEGCRLSLPSVVEGSDYSVRIPGSRVVTQVPMLCGDHALSVSLLEKID